LASFLLWIAICAFGHLTDACGLIGILIGILTIADAISLILGVIFTFVIHSVGCAVGSFIDFGWFGILLAITWWVGVALGCQLVESN